MFSENNIQDIKDRLGWSEFEKVLYVDKLSTANLSKTSGLTLNNFHKLVTIENVFMCQPDRGITDDRFNDYLEELLENVIREILTEVFVLDSRAMKNKDYSTVISEMANGGIFDRCVGYCHAVKVLELFTSTTRSNRVETIAGHNYANLMSELKGYSTKDGVLVSKGLLSYCEENRQILADYHYGSSGTMIYDATNCW